MSPPLSPHRLKATWILLGCCLLWGASFPLSKAAEIGQRAVLPEASSWFLAACILSLRFGLAAILLGLTQLGSFGRLTRLEFQQGLGIGLFGGAGILLQIDGIAYTAASTSAFLTACYVVTVPLFLALSSRSWPAPRVVIACALVCAGMAILSGIDWQRFRIGRGEAETILSSFFFGGQILWLERPRFAQNNSMHASVVMFSTTALLCLPVAFATQRAPSDWIAAVRAPGAALCIVVLTLLCTIVTFTMMNRWQRHVGATAAGLLYAVEPIFTSIIALFLPGWLSAYGGFSYPNEVATWSLVAGGGLITLANLVLQLQARPAELHAHRGE